MTATAPFEARALVAAGVVGLVEAYAAGPTTPVDATRAYLARIEYHDPELHAYTDVDRSGALAAAAASAARWSAGRPLSPIDGVPIGIKANIAVRGRPWTGGFEARRHHLAADDAACVARLRAAGAVLLGHLNMDEAALGASGDNPWYGRTRNPHDAELSPGGSSAGPAAAVAAGLCAAALGSDTMGSVRIPAACCGVVGFDPRRGTIDGAGVLPLAPSYDNVGVLARSVADVERLLAGIAGRGTTRLEHDGDERGLPASIGTARDAARFDASDPARSHPDFEAASAGDARVVAVLVVADAIALDPRVRRAFDAGQEAARAAGFRLQPLRLDGVDVERASRALLLVVEVEAAVEHEALLRETPDRVSPGLRRMLEWGATRTAARLGAALRDLRACRAAIRAQLAALGPSAALLAPVVPCAAFAADATPRQIAAFTIVGAIAGLAGLSLPTALPGDPLPGALQILALENATTLAIAHRLASRLPAATRPAAYRF